MVPLLIFFLGPQLKQYLPANTPDDWANMAIAVWKFVVRPIAVGGMLVGAAYTLFKMGNSLTAGLGKAFSDLRQTADERAQLCRTEQYMSFKIVFGLITLMFALMCVLYVHLTGCFGRRCWRRLSCSSWAFSLQLFPESGWVHRFFQ